MRSLHCAPRAPATARLNGWHTRTAASPTRPQFPRAPRAAPPDAAPAPTDASAPPGFRSYPSVLPPTQARPTTLASSPAAPGVWWLTQPFTPAPWTRFSAENRCVLVALPDASLLMVNPLPPTPEFVEHVQAVCEASGASRVTHVVCPSSSPEHWAALPDVLAACRPAAGATPWVPPGFFDGRRIGARFVAAAAVDALAASTAWRELPARGAPPEWGGGVDVALLTAPGSVCEAALRVRGARVAITADAAFGLAVADAAGASWLDVASARLAGIYGRVGCALAPVLLAAGADGRAFADDVGGWADSVDTLVPLHLSAPWDDGGRRLADALAFAASKKR